MVKVHKMYHKNNSLLKLNFNTKRDRWTTRPKNYFITPTLVFNMSFKQNKKLDSSITTNNDINPYD